MLPFELRHCGNSLVFSDFWHDPEEAKAENPYNSLLTVAVVSESFSGMGQWEADIADLVEFANEINALYAFEQSRVELKDIGYGSRIAFQMDKTGHVAISGELFGDAGCQSLTFEFEADQTSLKPFADALRQLYPFKSDPKPANSNKLTDWLARLQLWFFQD